MQSGLISTAIPVRGAISYLNPNYVESGNIYVKRFGRKSEYFLNIYGKTKYALGNNVTVMYMVYPCSVGFTISPLFVLSVDIVRVD